MPRSWDDTTLSVRWAAWPALARWFTSNPTDESRMGTETIACPHCGRETVVTVPTDETLAGVGEYRTGLGGSKTGDTDQTCRYCDERIAVYYE